MVVRKDGYSIVYRPEAAPLPFFCPVCTTALLSRDDEYCMQSLECCFKCAEEHAWPNLKRWKEGWRP